MKSTKPLGGLLFMLLLIIILAFGFIIAGGTRSTNPQPNYSQLHALPSGSEIGKKDVTEGNDKNIQVQTLGYTTPTPGPTTAPTPVVIAPGSSSGTCSPDGPRENCVCPEPVSFPSDLCPMSSPDCAGKPEFVPYHVSQTAFGHVCKLGSSNGPARAGCHGWCEAKPVIYLYPTTDTVADVRIFTSGTVVVSNPLYPKDGWQAVRAHPDGSLIYQNKTYRELFYETSVDTIHEPADGIVIQTAKLSTTLQTILSQLGLLQSERSEFLAYWIPRLQQSGKPYIFFSLLDPMEKERTDHIDISPKPDTFIQLMAYFKPMDQPVTTKPLLIIPPKPERIGFTAVEWGGVLDPTVVE